MRRHAIRIVFAIIAVAAAAVAIGDIARRSSARKLREAILAELQPVALKNCTLKRFGSANDGGYLMCENLIEPLDAAYSYGVGRNDDWGCEMSRRYHVPVHQYDCFDPARPICDGGTFVFHNECVGDRAGDRESHFFDTLENQISKNGDTGRHLIIKMDIEGAEWNSLLAAPNELLASIPQIAMEMHGFDDPKIVEVLRKLNRNFYLVNLHFNNWSCTPKAAPLPAWAYQALWVNKRIGVPDPVGACSRTHEPAKRARLADMARLSVARAAVAALRQRWNDCRGDSRSSETILKVGALSGYEPAMEYFRHIMEVVGTSVDGVGVFIVAAGMVAATIRLVLRLRDRAHGTGNYYSLYRQDVGRAILLGLEFLIAGDIIRTVVVAPTVQNVIVLGMIVLIRTFLSLSLQLEIEGKLPWQRDMARQPQDQPS